MDVVECYPLAWNIPCQKKGIYAIVCTKTWRSYVGHTFNSLGKRINSHLNFLKCGRHSNKELQVDFNKFSQQDFCVELLEEVSDELDLLDREEYWQDFGCNLYSKTQKRKRLPSLDKSFQDYFWSKVNRQNNGDCWLWNGSKNVYGYGRIQINKIIKGG